MLEVFKANEVFGARFFFNVHHFVVIANKIVHCACIAIVWRPLLEVFGASIDGGYCHMCSTSFVSNQALLEVLKTIKVFFRDHHFTISSKFCVYVLDYLLILCL